ncbi:MAG: outer membrane beta-barrel protein [Chlamydiota bacterium]
MMKKFLITCLAALPLMTGTAAQAEVHGKFDLGPVLMKAGLKSKRPTDGSPESGEVKYWDTNKHMLGVQGNGTLVWSNGFCLKPRMLWAQKHDDLYSGGLGAGWYLPVMKDVSLTPYAGMNFSHYTRQVNYGEAYHGQGNPQSVDLYPQHKFISKSPFVAVDFNWNFIEKWALSGGVSYAWVQTRTKTSNEKEGILVYSKGESRGFNYNVQVDYFINDHWGVNAAYAINRAANDDDEGMRGSGYRIGASYRF